MFKNNKIKIFTTVLILAFVLVFTFPPIVFADQTSDVSSFVTRLYNTCLDRGPDPAGLANWVNNLISGTLTGGQTAYGFVFSEELINKNLNNDKFLYVMYKAFFDRLPDPGGYNNWMGLLNSGSSREFVFSNFVNSVEFANICTKYGIQAGTVNVENAGAATANSPSSQQIIGSARFAALINESLNLLKTRDSNVYNWYVAYVSRIVEEYNQDPNAWAAKASFGDDTLYFNSNYLFASSHSIDSIGLASLIAHELNHFANEGIRGSMSSLQFEKLAFSQAVQTYKNLGAYDRANSQQYFVDHFEEIYGSIYTG